MNINKPVILEIRTIFKVYDSLFLQFGIILVFHEQGEKEGGAE